MRSTTAMELRVCSRQVFHRSEGRRVSLCVAGNPERH